MAKPDQVYREFIRRSHRLLGAYLAVYAWRNGLECLAIGRNEITNFWGIEKRVEKERLGWLQKDVADYFPHVESLQQTSTTKFFAVYLARKRFPVGAFDSSMSNTARVTKFTSDGFPSAVVKLPTEGEMLSILTSAIHGIKAFPAAS